MREFFTYSLHYQILLFLFLNEYNTTRATQLVNFKDLNKILRSKIFLHKDGQLRAAHVILGYTPSTKRFQNPKNIIKAKHPRLALIDMVVPGFLLTEPPPEATQDAQLLAFLVARLIYSQEPPNLLDNESEESMSESIQKVTDKDFDVFYRTDALDTS